MRYKLFLSGWWCRPLAGCAQGGFWLTLLGSDGMCCYLKITAHSALKKTKWRKSKKEMGGKKMLLQQLLCNVCLSAPLEWKSYCEMLVLLQLKMLSKLLHVGHVFCFFKCIYLFFKSAYWGLYLRIFRSIIWDGEKGFSSTPQTSSCLWSDVL